MMLADALAGIRVLDLTRLLPGPYLTMVLADLGADVVKIEAPVIGDYLRPMPPARGGISGRFLAINRNKRSLVLDLKSESGRAAFLRMAKQADVVVESFRPGVMDRLGIGYEALCAANPAMILCSISGYGQSGPYRERAGHDLNYASLAGIVAMGGERGGMPAVPGVQIGDFAGGALWSVAAVVSALFRRERSGQGAHLDIAMTEGAMTLLAAELGSLDCGITPAPSRGNQTLNGGLACYRLYWTQDAKYLSVAALEPKFWQALNQAIGRKSHAAELIAPPDEQERIASELAAIFATKTRDEWAKVLAPHDCCCEPVLELDEVAHHPQVQARDLFFSLDGGSLGPVKQLRTPLGTPAAKRLAPALGQHSREVLAEYGFSDDEIAALVS